ncbi:histone deacetylase family protein [Marinobacter sp. M216]|uniref:Histone deacetylase family protein n=1 Tax=Marinobacter albus TaxID=3030833 RepID=A0ABT7H914_9GAMM|nr:MULTISPECIES: histone deacetylase family protein [unclassified Marinobacter]MBW7471641.1 histone deacetylase family protein [Marinobacter sp. F4218]MDK9556041.1 histone deacetylase family protein [Marinobacter sp. M216]
MKTVFSPLHSRRAVKTELDGGILIAPHEKPSRAETILARVKAQALGEVLEPEEFGLDPVKRVHSEDYVAFLESCWADWIAADKPGEAIPAVWCGRGMRARVPKDIDGRLGYYSFAAETSISDGTWEAARASANVALTAQKLVAGGERAAFALCRPPGHHAHADLFGGYCFFNNAAIVAQAFRDQGAEQVAILDVDFHHGNGTQAIFYDRSDVLTISLHGDPDLVFPHFLGFEDETGEGEGEGFNLNLVYPPGTPYAIWSQGLETACERIAGFRPDALVVALGVDTFEDDPISFFKLRSEDYLSLGRRLGALGLPTVFTMEGGYDVEAIGVNAVNVMQGFDAA